MSIRNVVFACLLAVSVGGAAYAQTSSDTVIVPLTVDEGSSLQVAVTAKVRFKENEPVYGKIVEPVYAFDREVISSGTEVVGRISGFRKTGKLKRVFRMLSGNFTPVRNPKVTFETLVLADGTRIPIHTIAVTDTADVVRFNERKNTGGEDLKKSLASIVKQPGKGGVKNFLWSLSPYRPQALDAGTHFRAVLMDSLDFGEVVFERSVLEGIGSQPPPGTIIPVRLLTSLNSRTAQPGTSVEASLTRPIFSQSNQLLFPAGSTVHGEVLDADSARKWHHNGQLAFRLTSIEAPATFTADALPAQKIDGRLVSVHGVGNDHLRIDAEGATRISGSKKRFIAPAYEFVKAGRGINDTAEPLDRAFIGAYRSEVTKQLGSKNTEFGLTESITGAMIPPVGIGLGFFGAARSFYSNILGPGQDVEFPAGTLMEFRLE